MAETIPGYVWPALTLPSTPATNAPVVLVTAPGAMGKTAASRAVSAYLKCPLIDLARLPVGSDSLTGLLTRVLGWGQAASFITALTAGRATLVLDSVDEAQLLAGQEHFQAFLSNVAELLRGTDTVVPRVVIFGRRDAADTTLLTLDSLGISCVEASIAPLDYRRSSDFIDSYLDTNLVHGEHYRVHRSSPEPFGRLRETLFADITGALLGEEITDARDRWSEVHGFMGYPPVLMSLANWLAVDNPSRMRLHESSRATPQDDDRSVRAQRGRILVDIVTQIMERESLKVQQKMSMALGIAPSDPICNLLYSKEEQIVRCLSYMSGANRQITAPASLTGGQRATYEDQIETFVPDHPFLAGREFANEVFKDYVRAFFDTSSTADYQTSDDLGPLARRHAVGPFYCHFAAALLPRSQTGAACATNEDIVPEVIQSFRIGARGESSSTYLHRNDTVELSLTEVDPESDTVDAQLWFEFAEPLGVLELHSPISNCFVFSQHGVVLSSTTNELELGPNAIIFADQLEIKPKRIVARGYSDGSSDTLAWSLSMLFAKSAQHDANLTVTSFPARAIRISWPEPWHQWQPYVMPSLPAEAGVGASTSWQIMMGLRRILASFHRRAQADPTIVWERLSGFTIGRNRVFAAVLSALIELGVITVSTSRIHTLGLSKLSEYGVNYQSLFSEDFSVVLRDIHSAVAKTDAFQTFLHSGQ